MCDLKCGKTDCHECDCVNGLKGQCDKCVNDCDLYISKDDIDEECVEDLYEALYDCLKIPLDIEDVLGTKINNAEFKLGIENFSRICGEFVAGKNCGMKDEDIIKIILAQLKYKHDCDVMGYIHAK